MAIGAWSGRRVLAAGVAAGVAVAAFFINGLAALVDALEVPQKLSPFYWLLDSKPLNNGFDWAGLTLLAATTAVLLAAALWAFRCRDVAA
jgi:ABC-2 type transport system permease protein